MPRLFRIHPSIGVARVGNSPTEFFIGPERPGVPANYQARSDGFLPFKDAQGRIKRQAARFRIWEYQVRGGRLVPLREVTPGADGVVSVTWTVQLANRKAAFHVFDGQDGVDGNWAALRNPAVTRRDDLIIDPAPQSIEGPSRGPVAIALALGVKPKLPIRKLGELRTDERGHLIALGGHGESHSVAAPGTTESFLLDYANNDSWFDDTSDGPVTAVVDYTTEGGPIAAAAAEPAWLLVGPPDFAPPVDNIVRLWDLMWDLAVRQLALPDAPVFHDGGLLARLAEQKRDWDPAAQRFRSYRPSYTDEIRPILQRAIAARQVHDPEATRSFHANFLGDDADAMLATIESADGADLRDYIFRKMRDPAGTIVDPKQMPKGLGDEFYDHTDPAHPEAKTSPRRFTSVSHVQYALLRQWAEDRFIPDWKGPPPGPSTLAKAPLTPDGLDHASLENAVGAPFFPGIDVSWMVRKPEIYAEPFRLRHGARVFPHRPELSVGPGFLSQQMAIPWQADFYQCQKEPFTESDEGMYHMWWCAHRPDDVHVRRGDAAMQPWARKVNAAAVKAEAAANAEQRPLPVAPGYTALDTAKFMQMQKDWARLGFVVRAGGDYFEVEADGEPAPIFGNPVIAIRAGGAGLEPGATIDLGTALVGARGAPATIAVHNLGPAPLVVARIAIADATDFRLVSLPPANQQIPPGGSLSFDAVFEPKTPGRKTTTVRVDSNDPDVATFSVQLVAEVRSATTLVVQPTTVSPGETVTITWSGVAGATVTDWVGMYPSSSAANSPSMVWQYTSSGRATAGATARAAGTCTFVMPQRGSASYEFRLFAANGYQRLATTVPLTVRVLCQK